MSKDISLLHLDSPESEQIPGTYRFLLNGVEETVDGNEIIANEESNEEFFTIPEGYIILNKLYIGSNEHVLFLVAEDESSSELALVNSNGLYTTLVNAKLGFKLSTKIDAVYRLRRGCERMIYWVDPKPRVYNIDKPKEFQQEGIWQIDAFNLFKLYKDIPIFNSIEILENGTLPAGSYNASIQYLDSNLNPTEWITSSETILINHDSSSKDYKMIRGSTNLETAYQHFGHTNKSIRFNFTNLDTSFPYYRIAIIQATNGTGQVSSVVYSQEIPTGIGMYEYTGASTGLQLGTEQEIQQFNNVIDSAEHIEQLENRLVLSNLKGKQYNFCALQKYASKIKTDLALKEIVLNALVTSNPKNGTVYFDGTGYMPGEIYPFGIVYVFEDGTQSPVCHIPGASSVATTTMSKDNTCQSAYYTELANSCDGLDYWGVDNTGIPLSGKAIRHHRFPLRSEINEPLYSETGAGGEQVYQNQLNIELTGELLESITENFNYIIRYTVGNNKYSYEGTLDVGKYRQNDNPKINLTIASDTETILIDLITENGANISNLVTSTYSGLLYNVNVTDTAITLKNKVVRSKIFGINFSNIEIPKIEDTGEKIIGYYIVRAERDADNKSILDSAVLTPMITHDFYIASGYLAPKVTANRIEDDVVGMIHPEHKFLQKEYKNTSRIIQQGYYQINKTEDGRLLTQDVMMGTSYDGDTAKKREKDSDGFDLNSVVRNNSVSYVREASTFAEKANITEVFYLDALSSKAVLTSDTIRKEVFNVSCDNKTGAVQLKTPYAVSKTHDRLPYVILKRDLANPYANFRVIPYYKESKNFTKFIDDTEQTTIFNGDAFISSMRYTSTIYYDTRLRKRASKSGFWNAVIGVVGIIAGAVLIATGVGAGAGALLVGSSIAGLAGSALVVGFGLSQLSVGLKKEQLSKVYSELYDAGLRNTVRDSITDKYFAPNPEDDQVQWSSDHVTDLWFESTVNMGLRQGTTSNIPDFLDAPAQESTVAELNSYLLDKLTVLDAENQNGRLYKGYASTELYELNLDYLRRNKQKIFFALGIEYDCCSDCRETFPHRTAYSEPAFQEELSDNYRTFLPNNYRDLDGETGVITDIFKMQNSLYIQTESALWHIPQNIQERITGDIVSFIGTGDFFGITPRKIVDDEQNSAGTLHKFATIKTKYGVFFISENESKIYHFTGKDLKPITDNGLFSWFKSNLKLKSAEDFYKSNNREFTYNNNTSLALGNGFISTYDTRKERIIFTKKDFIFSGEFKNKVDYEIHILNKDYILVFNNFQATINTQRAAGFTYQGIIDNQMKFYKLNIVGSTISTEYLLIDGQLRLKAEVIQYDNSWTMSYSLKKQGWIGWHSYTPNMYLHINDEFYCWNTEDSQVWKFNKAGSYQNFCGKYYPHILELVKTNPKGETTTWEDVTFSTQAEKFSMEDNSFYDSRLDTFNKLIAYNRRQCTGLLNLVGKDMGADEGDYLMNQIMDSADSITIDKNELNWSLNDLRDLVDNYTKPMFKKSIQALAIGYYIDKVLNEEVINPSKDWSELESFRDKYIVLRFIFDNFDKQDIRLTTQYTDEFKIISK